MMKLIADKSAKKYEFTYLLPEFYTTAEVAKTVSEIEDLVKKHKGTIVSTEDWGKKDLAYKIKKDGKTHAQALYTHMIIELEAKSTPQFEKDVYLNERIVRHLLVVAEKESKALQSEDK
jgi:small subunit ribosomal protein S6